MILSLGTKKKDVLMLLINSTAFYLFIYFSKNVLYIWYSIRGEIDSKMIPEIVCSTIEVVNCRPVKTIIGTQRPISALIFEFRFKYWLGPGFYGRLLVR